MAYVAQASKKTLETDLKEEGMDHLFTEIEMPLVFTLADMENEGIIACRRRSRSMGTNLQCVSLNLKSRSMRKREKSLISILQNSSGDLI